MSDLSIARSMRRICLRFAGLEPAAVKPWLDRLGDTKERRVLAQRLEMRGREEVARDLKLSITQVVVLERRGLRRVRELLPPPTPKSIRESAPGHILIHLRLPEASLTLMIDIWEAIKNTLAGEAVGPSAITIRMYPGPAAGPDPQPLHEVLDRAVETLSDEQWQWLKADVGRRTHQAKSAKPHDPPGGPSPEVAQARREAASAGRRYKTLIEQTQHLPVLHHTWLNALAQLEAAEHAEVAHPPPDQ